MGFVSNQIYCSIHATLAEARSRRAGPWGDLGVIAATVGVGMTISLSAVRPVRAADIVKANNTNDLVVGSAWVGGVTPGTADMAVWDSTVTGANTVRNTNGGTNPNFAGIRIANPGGPVTLTFRANSVTTLGTSSSASSTLIDMSAATQDLTFNAGTSGLRFAGGSNSIQTFDVVAGRTLAINSPLFAQANNKTLQLSGGGTVLIGGAISGSGSNLFGFRVNGPSVTLSGGNTFGLGTGSFTVAAGSLNIANDAALGGVDGMTVSGGTVSPAGGDRTLAPNVNLTGAGRFGGSSNLTLSGAVTGAGSLVKVGTGNLSLPSAGNTYTGGTVVEAGILTTASDFTMSGANGFTMAGVPSPTAGSDYGGIVASAGTLTYGGDLALTLSGTASPGAAYSLFSFSGGSQAGSFSNIVLGGSYVSTLSNSGGVWTGTDAGLNFAFTETTGQFAVSAVPEPVTFGLAGLATVALAAGWIRRRNGRHTA